MKLTTRATKKSLVHHAVLLAMELGVDDFLKATEGRDDLSRARRAVLSAEDEMNRGMGRPAVVESISHWRSVTKADWRRMIRRLQFSVDLRVALNSKKGE